jgi:hypothetical protein
MSEDIAGLTLGWNTVAGHPDRLTIAITDAAAARAVRSISLLLFVCLL